MGKKKVAELLVDVLAAAGVRQIYGVSGDSLNGITDSIRAKKEMQWIHVRHEETAAFAAGAEAHLTGGLAVCAGSCGPGNLHLINGLYDCHRSRVPVLAIAAQIPSNEIGSGYFQETKPEHLFAQCSHYCELVSQPEQMPRVLDIAIQTALSRRGVSVVAIPGDVALVQRHRARPRRQAGQRQQRRAGRLRFAWQSQGRGASARGGKPVRNSGCTARKDVPGGSPENIRSRFHCLEFAPR